jgi:uncharacterized small protein (DUF1192 family)
MPIVFKSYKYSTHNSNCIIVFIDEIYNMASLGDEIAAQEAEIAKYTNERDSIVISDQTGDERRELLESRRDQLLATITATQNTLNILLARQSQQQGNNSHSSVPASNLICVNCFQIVQILYFILLHTHNSNCIIVFIDEIYNMASLGDEIAAQKAEIAKYTNERDSIVISDQTGDERRELLESRRDQLLATITATQNTLNILLARHSQQQGNNFHSSVPASTLTCVTISGEWYHGGTAE